MTSTISEEQVTDGFHTFLQDALVQAKREKLLDADILASAEADIMIAGPALSLFFGALRSSSNPPSVPIPRRGSSKSDPPDFLSPSNCPPTFARFVKVWAATVPVINALSHEHQHDLARTICGLQPLSEHPPPELNSMAADLRAVAIEIGQRRTFQERYQADLQTAIDAGYESSHREDTTRVKAHFEPPPMYEAEGNTVASGPSVPKSQSLTPPPHSKTPPAAVDDPALELIRETLYASLGDVISNVSSLRCILATDPPRAYFSTVGLAILNVSLTSITPTGSVRGVLGRELILDDCPAPLRPLMDELGSISREAQQSAKEDDEDAMRLAALGEPIPEPRMDRVRRILENGVGDDQRSSDENPRRSLEGRAVQLANKINTLALSMTEQAAFKAYAKDVFNILRALG